MNAKQYSATVWLAMQHLEANGVDPSGMEDALQVLFDYPKGPQSTSNYEAGCILVGELAQVVQRTGELVESPRLYLGPTMLRSAYLCVQKTLEDMAEIVDVELVEYSNE